MPPIVELRGVGKRFFGTEALRDVDLSIEPATVHALVGENGAGKSTLGKIIGGAIKRDEGDLLVEGRPVAYRSPRDALADGIAVIQQELTLVPGMSVLENVLLGVESSVQGVLRSGAIRQRFDELLARTGFELDPDAVVGGLRVADQQLVEILRAMSRHARVIVMDEPTAALSRDEAEKLHLIVRGLRERGVTIVYVSHFLEEVLELADAVTVLRSGRLVETLPASEATVDRLIVGMLGREMTFVFPPKTPPAPDAPPVLEVVGLTCRPAFEDVSLTVRAGEIVGLAGLVGSGRSEVARAIFGADRADSGEVRLCGEPMRRASPRASLEAGIALVPESRKDQGLIMELSESANVSLPYLGSLCRLSVVNGRRERGEVEELLRRLDVHPVDANALVTGLSGGNQQKVLFGKALFKTPKLVLLDEPTRGVDIGAKRSIYDIIVGLARAGMAVLLISSELEEVLGLAHRIVVLRKGRTVAEIHPEAMTSDAVMHAAFGLDAVPVEG